MRLIVCCAVVAFLAIICHAEQRSYRSLADAVPVLKKPIIIDNAFSNPDAIAEADNVAEILSKEPEAAAAVPDADGEGGDDNPDENAGEGENGEAPAAGEEGAAAGEGEAAAGEEGGDDDDATAEIQEEIDMLTKLIEEGKKIQTALPEKEARLAELQKKLAEQKQAGDAAKAQEQMKDAQNLLDETNAKIAKLKKKLQELEESKAGLEKQIEAFKATIAGGGAPDAATESAAGAAEGEADAANAAAAGDAAA
jgi:uncharacterized coiled-coil protein SlyX